MSKSELADFAHNLVSGGRGQTFNIVYNGSSVELQVIGSPAALVWRGDGAGNVWDTHNGVSGTTNWINAGNPDGFFTTDAVTFDDSGSNTPPVALTGSLQPSSITVASANNYTFAGSGQLSGSGPLTNVGPGTLSIVNSNNFTGKTFLTGGTLAITNETALGANPCAFAADQLSIDNATLSVGAAATFKNLNRGITLGASGGTLSHGANAVTISNTIAGAGALTKNGTGTLTMSGSNSTYTGGTIINDGQVIYGHGAGLGRGANTFGASGFFVKPWTLRNGIVDLAGRTSYETTNVVGSSASIGIPVMLYDGPIVFGGTGGTATNGWGNGIAATDTVIYDATGNPGHAIEGAWFILHEGKHRKDSRLIKLGCQMLDWMWARGWDRECGGIFYFRDVFNKPVQEYWHDMKFWWPHDETIIATLLAYQLTGDSKYAEWHQLVHDWSFKHFADPQHGEWYGYLHRDGRVSVPLKGNLWKSFFHHPRALWYCARLCEEMKPK